MDISAIVVTYNSKNEIRDCIESLYNNTTRNIEVFIVDNCSTDNTVQIVKDLQTRYKSLHLIETGANLGLAYGNNIPIERLAGEYTLIVNPDAQAMEFAVDKLYDKITSDPQIGMIGPLCLSEGNKNHSSFHQHYGLFHILSWRLLPYSLMRFFYDNVLVYRFKEGKVNFVSGEFYLARTDVYQAVRGYDKHYFLSICDVADLAIKFRNEGYINYFYPKAKIFHPGGKSNNQVKLLTQIKGVDGELYYLFKNKGLASAKIAKSFFLSYYRVRRTLYLAKYRFFSNHKNVFTKLKIAHVLVNYLEKYPSPSKPNDH